MGYMDDVKDYVVNNKLRSIGVLWASVLGSSLAYQWSRPIPTQLKIIHSRVYAQALTLGSLAAVAFVEHYDHKNTTSEELARAHTRLADLERKFGFGEFGSQSSKDADAK
mmetsp:Transcript_20489/g.61685  ORF Transcript_20489/g.61685 Transcript_20489/m.61685 type:complete len:110 (-) Transcript_20489:578-907(-)|eukprot:CAMPEP_0206150546 /NCGR_PEP_ID=MMETSP1473-20131121/38355_1 /ASSEMBLY_ACC=CAM_ASM_001109 /TAXON_ID=1461547 /ORGANISM="Stichococcus sp, Strain RCC1054" /LENGTH=109 /DNA_ID=CAMNT_0053548053 /DNA_START=854 /DNA_END=1183 /DNA_ORIENTATION=-